MKLHKIISINYSNAINADSVVVLGAGPSLTLNIKNIKRYILDNKSLVIAANYNFEGLGIKANFTYLTDKEKLKKNISTIRSDIIVPVSIFDTTCTRIIENFCGKKKYKVFKVGVEDALSVYDCNGGLSIDSAGNFNHSGLGIAGLGALAVSLIFKPKRILIAGIDDPVPGHAYKTMYDGRKVFYGKEKKCRKVIRHFTHNILPTLRSKNIRIDTYENVKFFGLDKKNLNFNIL